MYIRRHAGGRDLDIREAALRVDIDYFNQDAASIVEEEVARLVDYPRLA
jgi:hypothetical protein